MVHPSLPRLLGKVAPFPCPLQTECRISFTASKKNKTGLGASNGEPRSCLFCFPCWRPSGLRLPRCTVWCRRFGRKPGRLDYLLGDKRKYITRKCNLACSGRVAAAARASLMPLDFLRPMFASLLSLFVSLLGRRRTKQSRELLRWPQAIADFGPFVLNRLYCVSAKFLVPQST